MPPLLSIPSDFPDSAVEISTELRKQESLLNQIHAEMHAGFITTARDQQLWEAQRIVTQLKVIVISSAYLTAVIFTFGLKARVIRKLMLELPLTSVKSKAVCNSVS